MTDRSTPRVVATGLAFPEGPVALPDGSVLLVEIRTGSLSRVRPDGVVEVIAELDGGPNGVAIGPDGAAYVCNNGGMQWVESAEGWVPRDPRLGPPDVVPGSRGGWIERVDLSTGEHRVLYTDCDGLRLRGPNDVVFDDHGGFWFTDLGKRRAYDMDIGGLFYARADGSHIERAPGTVLSPNGVGLSPDGSRVYVAETMTGRLVAFDVEAPGKAGEQVTIVAATKERFDSLAVEADGRVVVAALPRGLSVISPDGDTVEQLPIDDSRITNICFGGPDLRTAYLTCVRRGVLLETIWPRPGLQLHHQILPTR